MHQGISLRILFWDRQLVIANGVPGAAQLAGFAGVAECYGNSAWTKLLHSSHILLRRLG